MKILFCLSSMPVGGLEVFSAGLASELTKKGEEIGILILRPCGDGVNLIEDNKINIFNAQRKGKFDFFFLTNVYKSIRQFKPEAILSLSPFSYFVLEFLNRLHAINIPHIIAFHSPKPACLKDIVLNRLFIFFSRLWKARYVFVSHRYLKYFRDYYSIPEEKGFVIYNGIDTDFFSPTGRKAKGVFTIIHIANIIPEKDQWTLLKSLEVFDKEVKGWRLVFVGEDRANLRDRFEAYLREKGISDKVEFMQSSDRDVIKNLLSESDIFILTSAVEVLPVAALEAMAAGLPCILTNVGGCPEVVKDGYNGYLVNPKDYNMVADRLKYLYKNADLMNQMGKNAREVARERFNIEKSAQGYLEVFAKVKENYP